MPGPGKPGLNKPEHAPGQIRIIGGHWRGRKISVADAAALRPTPNRARETLFNWLAPHIEGAACLDLYAGSGALGFEALSRGAASVCMVDADSGAVAALRRNQARLQADAAEIIHTDALQWLQQNTAIYDIVFLDPPFQSGLLERSCELLLHGGHLSEKAHIYTEAETEQVNPGLNTIKTARAGRVIYCLHERCE
ncbi:MAG: 16S rRNA (guanine(966)-N(2))-methyltransferase RsmD [Gammaproteobacteria bacterium]